ATLVHKFSSGDAPIRGLMKKILARMALYFGNGCLAMLILSACASGGSSRGPDYDAFDVKPHPATSINEVFSPPKAMPERPSSQDAVFFFKECNPGDARWPSRTGYECDYPF